VHTLSLCKYECLWLCLIKHINLYLTDSHIYGHKMYCLIVVVKKNVNKYLHKLWSTHQQKIGLLNPLDLNITSSQLIYTVLLLQAGRGGAPGARARLPVARDWSSGPGTAQPLLCPDSARGNQNSTPPAPPPVRTSVIMFNNFIKIWCLSVQEYCVYINQFDIKHNTWNLKTT